MARKLIHIETGPKGWLKAQWLPEGSKVENAIFVRFRPPESDRGGWVIDRLAASRASLQRLPALARDAPLLRIEDAVNASDVFREGLRDEFDAPEPDDLDSAFTGSTAGRCHSRS